MLRVALPIIVLLVSALPAFAQQPTDRNSQQDREKYAEKAFGRLQLSTDSFVVSPEFKAAGFKLELRGRQIRQVKELFDKKDWLGLLSLGTTNGRLSEYPSERRIDDAVQLINYQECYIFVNTGNSKPIDALADKTIAVITVKRIPAFVNHGPKTRVDLSVASDEHPDGTGFIVRWMPGGGRTFVFYGKATDAKKFGGLPGDVQREMKRLDLKYQLGEFTDEEHRDAVAKLADETEAQLSVLVGGKKSQ